LTMLALARSVPSFPYTTLFRSLGRRARGDRAGDPAPTLESGRRDSWRGADLAAGCRPGGSRYLLRLSRTDTQSNYPVTDHHVYRDRKSTRLNSSHVKISYAVFC